MENYDYSKLSLADFLNKGDNDIVELSKRFADYYDDVIRHKHSYWRRVSTSGSGPVMTIFDPYTNKERDMIYLASNDYLNLTRHPRTIEAGRRALEKYGSGAGSVPLLGGTLDLHIELEKKIAKFKGCESAIIFTNGFGSNSGSVGALLGDSGVAILDMLVHASIIDGCKQSNIEFFKHNNMESLEKVLAKVKDKHKTKIVIVDGVYSMDGDIAYLDKIVEIAHSYGALVMVDEAHATGVIGKNGRGTPEYYNLEGKVDIVAGTFSKAVGVVGGFVASTKDIINYLYFYTRSYMFSTAQTPQTAGSIIEALNVIEEEPQLRERLWRNINHFRKGINDIGFNTGNAETAIFPLIIGDDTKVKEMCRELHENDIYVNPVLYPAVAKRLARIRISLMSAHEIEHLDKTLNVLEYLAKKYDVVKK